MVSIVQVTAPHARYVEVMAPGAALRRGRRNMHGYAHVDEGVHVTVRAQVRDGAGNLITRADVQTVHYWVYLDSDPSEPVWEQGLGVIETMPPTVQSGPEWYADDVGYTFAHTVEVSDDLFFEGGRRYKLEYRLTLHGSPYSVVWVHAMVVTRPVLGRRA